MIEEILKVKIEAAIKETLVIKNPESIWRAVEKIIKIYDKQSS